MGKRINVFRRFWGWVSQGYTLWGILKMIFTGITGTLGGFLTWLESFPPYVIFFGVLLGIVLGLVISNALVARRILKIMSLEVSGNPICEDSVKTKRSADFNNEKIYIAALARDSMLVKDKVFVDCELIGPAIIHFKKSVITNCLFDAKLENMLIVVDSPRVITGIVGFEECVFKKCEFSKIGIITGKAGEEMFKEDMGKKSTSS